MDKVPFVVLLSFFVLSSTFSAWAQQETAPQTADVGTTGLQSKPGPSSQASDSSADACANYDVKWELIYPAIGSSFVGGTIPNMPMSPGFSLRWALLRIRQFRIKGQFALTPGCALFVFKNTGQGEYRPNNYQILACSNKVNLNSNGPQTCTHPISTTSHPSSLVLAVPYSKINLLSRAKYATSDLTAVSSAYAGAAGSILTAIASGVHKTAAKERALGIAAGALALYYYFAFAKPRLGDNYVAIFVEKKPPPKAAPFDTNANIALNGSLIMNEAGRNNPGPVGFAGNLALNQPAKSDDLFKVGDVMMFRIPNHHDYYNISMILSGEKGWTFISETAERTGK